MKRAKQLVAGILLLVLVASFGATSTWSQAEPEYQQWIANAEAMYEPGVDENYLLNQLETEQFVTALGRGGEAKPGMYFPNFDILDVNGARYDLYETTKEQGQFTILFTGSGFT